MCLGTSCSASLGSLSILLARVIALCCHLQLSVNKWLLSRFQIRIEKERCHSQLKRFSKFNFQKENEGIVSIYNLNHIVFELKFPYLQPVLINDLSKIDMQVGIINNLMPNWSGDMKLCPTHKHHVPIIYDMIFLGWTKLYVFLSAGHQMYIVVLFHSAGTAVIAV
jgi:hypothetical protein